MAKVVSRPAKKIEEKKARKWFATGKGRQAASQKLPEMDPGERECGEM